MGDEPRELMNKLRNGEVSRREFIELGGMLGLSMAAIQVLLAGCAPKPTPSPTPMPATPTPVPGVTPTAAPTTAPAPTAVPGQPRRGGVLRYSCPVVSQVDPAYLVDLGGTMFTRAVYDFLVRVDYNLQAVPSLAESWEPSADGKTWTFHLRRGVRFHDGSPFTADDVLYSLNRYMDPETGCPIASVLTYVEEIEKVDDFTVVFHLAIPNADLAYHLGEYQVLMLSHSWEGDFSKDPVGTGPFKLKELIIGDHATFVRNDDYWQEGLPYVDELQHIYIPEPVTAVSALAAGEIDIIDYVPIELVDVIKANPDCEAGVVATPYHVAVHMRVDVPPWNDNRVRLALKYSVDREKMRTIVGRGYGDLANDHPIASVWKQWWTDIGYREQDIEKAKALLAEAGYPDGVDLHLVTNSTQPFVLDTAVAVQEMGKAAGFRITIDSMTEDLYWGVWLEEPFCATGWGFRGTPTPYLLLAYMCDAAWNESHYCNPQLDDLIEAVGATVDDAERKKTFEQIERLMAEEGPVLIPLHLPAVQGYRKSVQDFHPGGEGRHFLDAVWLSE